MSSDGKRLKTSNDKSVVSDEDKRSRRSHVMNDDILGLICNELNVKQLLRLESVCNQFMDCVGSALQRKNGLRIGSYSFYNRDPNYHSSKEGTISKAIVEKYKEKHIYDNYYLIESKDTLNSILGKCLNIKSLYLRDVIIDGQIISVIVSRCPQLKRLYLYDICAIGSNKEVTTAWKPLLSQLSHLTLEGVIDGNILKLLPKLASLESIELNELYDKNKYSTDLFKCLPQNIRCFKSEDMLKEGLDSLDVLMKRCPQLQELTINEECGTKYSQHFERKFAQMCGHFKLKSFDFAVKLLPTHVFITNIPKLNQLRRLYVNSNFDFDTNAMQSMPSLKTLSLYGVKCWPKMFTKMRQIYPNVKHLRLNDIQLLCDCDEDNEDMAEDEYCLECIHKCMQFVSQLPQLKRLTIDFEVYVFPIVCNDLKLFTELKFLYLHGFNGGICDEELFDFVLHCIENTYSKKYFKLKLDPDIEEDLLQSLNDLNITIPKNFVIDFHKHCLQFR